jgi:hypothetical protein
MPVPAFRPCGLHQNSVHLRDGTTGCRLSLLVSHLASLHVPSLSPSHTEQSYLPMSTHIRKSCFSHLLRPQRFLGVCDWRRGAHNAIPTGIPRVLLGALPPRSSDCTIACTGCLRTPRPVSCPLLRLLIKCFSFALPIRTIANDVPLSSFLERTMPPACV